MTGRISGKKQVLIAFFTMLLVLAMVNVAYAQDTTVNVFLEGGIMDLKEAPAFIEGKSGRTLVPIRFIAEGLDGEVDWNPESGIVRIVQNDRQITLRPGSKEIEINGEKRFIDVSPCFKGDRVFVPLRIVSEVLGARVLWDGDVHVNIENQRTPLEDHIATGIPIGNHNGPIVPELVKKYFAEKYLIFIDTNQRKLFYFEEGSLVGVYPVGVGRLEKRLANGQLITLTPKGVFRVYSKEKNPPYRKLGIPGGAPNNPLGIRVLWFFQDYGIHGNSDPDSIGGYVSAGCVRMYNEDILYIYNRAPIGTLVVII